MLFTAFTSCWACEMIPSHNSYGQKRQNLGSTHLHLSNERYIFNWENSFPLNPMTCNKSQASFNSPSIQCLDTTVFWVLPSSFENPSPAIQIDEKDTRCVIHDAQELVQAIRELLNPPKQDRWETKVFVHLSGYFWELCAHAGGESFTIYSVVCLILNPKT